MAENLGKLPFKRGQTLISGHGMAAEGIEFPRRWDGGMICTNLDGIWEMSDQSTQVRARTSTTPWSKLRTVRIRWQASLVLFF
jgi:hypothetical protein